MSVAFMMTGEGVAIGAWQCGVFAGLVGDGIRPTVSAGASSGLLVTGRVLGDPGYPDALDLKAMRGDWASNAARTLELLRSFPGSVAREVGISSARARKANLKRPSEPRVICLFLFLLHYWGTNTPN